MWIVVDLFRLLGDLAGKTRPRGGEAALVAARLAAPALVRDMLGEHSPPHIWHSRHDLRHGHGHDLLGLVDWAMMALRDG
ncbi:MAG: hypothetical protein ABR608_11725 [Pseudonocardiaceae bacterium]